MNFKLQLSLSFVLIYSILISISILLTYRAFKTFSEEAFFDRLEQKAHITVELLAELKKDDTTINHIINENSLLKNNHEKIYVFDKNNRLIYENGKDVNFEFGVPLIEKIRKEKEVEFLIQDSFQVCGIGYIYNNKDYVVVIIAKDDFGEVKLNNLKEYIIIPLILTIFLVFIAAYYYVKQIFKPIDKLNATIQKVTDTNLYQHLEVKSTSKDINQIAVNFNRMLDRLKESFETQKNFNQSASHQLKTPLAVMSSLIRKMETNPEKETIQLLQDENDKMAKLVDYLLLINRLRGKAPVPFTHFRIDELLFEVSEEAEELHGDFSLLIDIKNEEYGDDNFTYFGNKILIKSALTNLINNPVLYSIERKVTIKLFARNELIQILFINDGKKALKENIFSPFIRSENNTSIPGNGLGLHIVKSIIEFHKGTVTYHFSETEQEHIFTVELHKNK
jgi:signal transduction histidine kinase